MAVTFATGFEGGVQQVDTGASLTSAVYSTTQARTGVWSMRCNASSGAPNYFSLPTAPAGWLHFGLYVATLPSVDRVIAGTINASTIHVKLTTAGALAVYINTTLLDTTSTTPFATPGWHWVGIRRSTTVSVTHLQIDGFDALTGTTGGIAWPTTLGFNDTAASTADAYFDDVVMDDGGFLNPSKVDFAFPISDNTRTNVTAGAGGTTDLWDAVNNVPPAGVASASETNTTNIEFPASLAELYTANLETYTTLGLVASDTLIATRGVFRHGEDIATGTKNGSYLGGLNGCLGETINFVFGNNAGAHAAESGANFWVTIFATINTTSLSVTLEDSPTMSIQRASEARVGCVDFMAMLVVWTPAVARVPKSTPYPQLVAH